MATTSDPPQRERHDRIVRIVAIVGVVIAGCALILTSCQIWAIRDNAQRQLRAYVGVVVPPDNQRINRFFPPEVPTVRLNVRNFGQTPAYKASYIAASDIRAFPLPKDNDYAITVDKKLSNPVTIFPGIFDLGDIKIVTKRALTAEEIASIQDCNVRRLYAWGTISYEDAFKAQHYTNFCVSFCNLTAKDVQYEPCNDHTDSN